MTATSAAAPAAPHRHNVHLILQGKGGVGKSVAAAFLAQFLGAPDKATCIDTDPCNATFAAYQALDVQRVEIMQDDATINPRRFDEVIECIMAAERAAVIDCGSSAFVPLAHYLLTNDILALLDELKRTLVLHVLVTGGPSILDTLHGLSALVKQFKAPCRFVVWLNPYHGDVKVDHKGFEELKVFTDNRTRISALIKLPALQPDTFGADLKAMLLARRTFDDAIADPKTGIVVRQRLKLIRQNIFAQLQAAAGAGIL